MTDRDTRDEIARIIATKCALLETRFTVDLDDSSKRGPDRKYPNWQSENAADALIAAGLVVPSGLTADALLRRFAASGYEVGISPLISTSPDWRVSVHDTRSGTSVVQYGPSLVTALEKALVAVSLAWADALSTQETQ